ncbi:hypothetical protein [Roseivirga pacifica]|uniref:hypothetical protein n=1 Tax=Roseivirga pacifica TaxID=1267423 RepID=UPI003BAFA8EC
MTKPKIAGGIQILISLYWIYRNLEILYDYKIHPEVLRVVLIPESVLFLQTIVGLIGLTLGFLVYHKKLKIRSSYFIFGALWLVGFGTEYILVSF